MLSVAYERDADTPGGSMWGHAPASRKGAEAMCCSVKHSVVREIRSNEKMQRLPDFHTCFHIPEKNQTKSKRRPRRHAQHARRPAVASTRWSTPTRISGWRASLISFVCCGVSHPTGMVDELAFVPSAIMKNHGLIPALKKELPSYLTAAQGEQFLSTLRPFRYRRLHGRGA